MLEQETLRRLVREQRPGFSLDQAFYVAEDILEAELERFLGHQWIAAGHISEIPRRGDYFLFEALNASVIVARGADDAVHAMHNVCRHRGARVCEQPRGRASLFTCRYHGWSYRINGDLAAWRHMPPGLDPGQFPLRRCGVAVLHGIILISLEAAGAPDVAALAAHTQALWSRFDLAHAKVAISETYRIAANWKLAVENTLECYHCLPCHPEYTAANAFVRADEKASEADVANFQRYQAQWREKLGPQVQLDAGGILEVGGQITRARMSPMAPGRLTGSADGSAVAPLLGNLRAYDESVTSGCFGFLTYLAAMCDYALLVSYLPRTARSTDVTLKWLVREDARDGIDYDAAKLRWLWDQTTLQDKGIVELNAAGVASRGYAPGPYSTLEPMTADFIARYLKLMDGAA
ncbi:MAG: aromatic ring-hydroxylating dioxygenase subunit alpha [Steroidobacteraceae bacterium]